MNVVDRIDKTAQPHLYRGADCMEKFVEQWTETKKGSDVAKRVRE